MQQAPSRSALRARPRPPVGVRGAPSATLHLAARNPTTGAMPSRSPIVATRSPRQRGEAVSPPSSSPSRLRSRSPPASTARRDTDHGGRGNRGGLAFAAAVTMTVEAKKVNYIVSAPGTIEAVRARAGHRPAWPGVVDTGRLHRRPAGEEGRRARRHRLGALPPRRQQQQGRARRRRRPAAEGRRGPGQARAKGAMAQHPGLIPGEELETYRDEGAPPRKADTSVASENLKLVLPSSTSATRSCARRSRASSRRAPSRPAST